MLLLFFSFIVFTYQLCINTKHKITIPLKCLFSKLSRNVNYLHFTIAL